MDVGDIVYYSKKKHVVVCIDLDDITIQTLRNYRECFADASTCSVTNIVKKRHLKEIIQNYERKKIF